jgi:hypothetical protein
MTKIAKVLFITLLLSFAVGLALGQDTRTVNEPIMPGTPGGATICAQFKATKYLAVTNTLNIDPWNPTSTSGSTSFGSCAGAGYGSLGCFGGTSIEPSATPTYSNGETTDNTAFNSALASCPSGQVLEIVPDYNFSPPKYGIVLAPFTIPNGVGILKDPGIKIAESRNITDYSGSCGTIPSGTGSSSCPKFITASQPSSSGIGIYGYGMIDARAWDKFTTNATCPSLSFCGFAYNSIQSYGNVHQNCQPSQNGSPRCVPAAPLSGGATYGKANGPNVINFAGASNVIIYKSIIKECGQFCVYWGGNSGVTTSGFTFWGGAIISAFNHSNTDGIDPSYKVSNFTITGRPGTTPGNDALISNGDNQIAIKSDCGSACDNFPSGLVSNGTIDYLQTRAGIGIYAGTDISGGISNIALSHITQNGNTNNGQQEEGIGIDGSSLPATAGVNNFTATDICQQNLNKANAFQNQGTFAFNGVSVSNDNYIGSYGTEFEYEGSSASALLNLTLNNITNSASTSGTYKYLKVSGTNVSFNSSISGTGVTNTITNPGGNTPYTCNSSSSIPLRGELTMRTGTGIGQTNLYTYTTAYPVTTPYIIQAIITPSLDWPSTKEDLTLTQPVILHDSFGGSPVTANFVAGSNGTLVEFPISSPAAGTHIYTAEYTGDSNYPGVDYTWGPLTVTITGTPPPPTPTGTFSITGKKITITGTQITIEQQ